MPELVSSFDQQPEISSGTAIGMESENEEDDEKGKHICLFVNNLSVDIDYAFVDYRLLIVATILLERASNHLWNLGFVY